MKKLFVLASITLSTTYASLDHKVIYGIDNRVELRKSPFASLKNSVAGMIDKRSVNKIEKSEDFIAKYFGDLTYYRGVQTCEDFKFREQATLPNCTGFLISEDILVTAGHCVVKYFQQVKDTTNDNCRNNIWAFGYEDISRKKEGIKFAKNDIYECASIIEASYTSTADFALIKLDRKTVDKTAVALNSESINYDIDSDIFVVGHPTGLPLKIAGGAKIAKNIGDNMFVANLDTFAGNSGSPIFNYQKEVIGVLVSGETDYFYDKDNKCVMPNKCDIVGGDCNTSSSGFASGETGTKIHLVEKALESYKKRLEAAKETKEEKELIIL